MAEKQQQIFGRKDVIKVSVFIQLVMELKSRSRTNYRVFHRKEDAVVVVVSMAVD